MAPVHTSRSRSPPRLRSAVDEVVTERGTAFCSRAKTLGYACEALLSARRTAAIVGYTDDGRVCGVLTENDILAALVNGTPHDCSLEAWLASHDARFPRAMVSSLTVSPEDTVMEAAAVMAAQAERDSGYACHHVILTDEVHETRLLSALDIARAMMNVPADTEEAGAATLKVKHAMKARSECVVCSVGKTLAQAYRAMFDARQNCVLAVDECGDVHGIVTARDAMRTFSEGKTGEETGLAAWLHGLTLVGSIASGATLAHAAKFMADHAVHHVLVHGSEKKDVVGVLSALDIVRALSAHGILGDAAFAALGGS
eukprot:TRINITY_DN68155_c0_g1_i2.p1 TRINITY_DN68155_c0_g1~~TRINITY_DN68155_c0_g1_i2.p1  ORF type:complete len:314 (+),score=74.40 TRINITY_DN68155_c0_g1_i2:69-1010(+)